MLFLLSALWVITAEGGSLKERFCLLQPFTKPTTWNMFHSFHNRFNLLFPSFDIAAIFSFISFAGQFLAFKIPIIRAYLSDINFFNKIVTGLPCLTSTLTQLLLLITGLQHQAPPSTPCHLPLTSNLLSRCIFTLRQKYGHYFLESTLQSVFLFVFLGFLHSSEFSSSAIKFNPNQPIYFVFIIYICHEFKGLKNFRTSGIAMDFQQKGKPLFGCGKGAETAMQKYITQWLWYWLLQTTVSWRQTIL